MKLYASVRSPFVRKVVVSIHELGLNDQLEIIPITVRMEEINPEILSLNPLGKIPTLQLDDGTLIYDSFAIIDYLDEQCGRQLIPVSGDARRQVLHQHALANGFMDMLVLWRNERDKPKERQFASWITNFEEKTERALDYLEGSTKGLDEPPINLGQISIAVALSYLDFRFQHLNWRNGHPELTAWHAGFSMRQSMKATAIPD